MSEPWIRVYAGDMRADPGVARLNGDMRYALIQAWDLAKNGPGEIHELRSSDGSVMGLAELRRLASVDHNKTRAMFQRWASNDLCELVETTEGQLCTFPKLAKRQGIDRTAAQRMKRYRKRKRYADRDAPRDANVTVERYGPVTGETQSTDTEERKEDLSLATARRNEQWDGLVDVFGYSPSGDEARLWGKLTKQLAGWGATRASIHEASLLYRLDMPDATMTPPALVKHYQRLMARPNGRASKIGAQAQRLLGDLG